MGGAVVQRIIWPSTHLTNLIQALDDSMVYLYLANLSIRQALVPMNYLNILSFLHLCLRNIWPMLLMSMKPAR